MKRNILTREFIKELQKFQDRFADYFGVAALIFDNNGEAITQPSGFTDFCKMIRNTDVGGVQCRNSKKNLFKIVADGNPAVYKCAIFSELADAIVPLMWDGEVVGAWAVGQKRVDNISDERLGSVATEFGMNIAEFKSAYEKLPVTTYDDFNKAIYFLNTTISTVMRVREQDAELAQKIEQLNKITNITAHEMKEDLGMIIGYSDLINRRYSDNDDKLSDFVYQLYETSQKLLDVTEKLIDLTRERKVI